ncbi:hypothetical protein FOCC_FOCC013498, partial [Frankliniella occidentalis]
MHLRHPDAPQRDAGRARHRGRDVRQLHPLLPQGGPRDGGVDAGARARAVRPVRRVAPGHAVQPLERRALPRRVVRHAAHPRPPAPGRPRAALPRPRRPGRRATRGGGTATRGGRRGHGGLGPGRRHGVEQWRDAAQQGL